MASQEQLAKELGLINALIEDILQRRVVKGAYNGREYSLHSLSDLYALRASLEQQLAGATAGGRQVRQVVPRG